MTIQQASQLHQLARVGCQLLIGVILARSTITIGQVGQIEMLFYLTIILSGFWVSAYRTSALSGATFNEAYWSGLFRNFIFYHIGLLGIALLLKPFLLKYVLQIEHLPYYEIYWLFFILFSLGSFIVDYYIQRKEQTKVILYSLVTYGGLLLTYAAFYFHWLTLEQLFYALVIFATIRLWLSLPIIKLTPLDKTVQRAFKQRFTQLLPYMAIGGITALADGTLVNYFYKDDAVFAIYRFGARELPITTALASGLVASYLPLLTQNVQAELASFKASTKKLILTVGTISVVLLLVAKPLYTLVYGVAYIESATLFQVYLLVAVTRVLLPNTILISQQDSGFFWKVAIIESILNIILSYYFMTQFGLVGVALGTFLAFFVEKVIFFIRLQRVHGIYYYQVVPVRTYLGMFIILMLVYFLSQYF